MQAMTPQQARVAVQGGEAVIIDVREADETSAASVPGVTIIPMSEITGRIAEIPRDRTLILMCHSGARSESVARYLEANEGFEDTANLEGGIVAWHQAGLPVDGPAVS